MYYLSINGKYRSQLWRLKRILLINKECKFSYHINKNMIQHFEKKSWLFGTNGEGRTWKSSCTPNQKFCFVLEKRRYHFERAVTKCLSGTIWSCALYSPYQRQWHCLFLVTTTGMYTWLCIPMVFLDNKLWGNK